MTGVTGEGFMCSSCMCFLLSIGMWSTHLCIAYSCTLELGACLRGNTATQHSKKGSEKVLGRVLGKGS